MKKLLLPLISILSFGIILSGCEKLDTSDPILIAPDFINYVTTVKFSSNISNSNFDVVDFSLDNTTVSVTGPDADKVYDLQGGKTFKIVGGSVQLMLGQNAKFTSVSEYNVNLTVEPNGFVKRIIPVKFKKEIQTNSFTVTMLNESKLPTGTTLATKTGTVSPTTGLTALTTIVSNNAATQGVSTTVNVPSGIKMKDETGAVVSGPLVAKVISFDASSDITSLFPGGLTQDNVVFAGGVVESGTFETAGFASVSMSVNGKSVKSFDGGLVTINITLSKNNYNPTTNKPYVAGDKITISSYDTTKGQWSFESEGTVQKAADNSLFVSFQTSHLSYFNLGPLLRSSTVICKQDPKIVFNWDADVKTVFLRIDIFKLRNGIEEATGRWYTRYITKGIQNTLDNAPDSKSIIKVYTPSGLLIGRGDFQTLCQNITMDLNVPQPLNTITLRYGNFCPKLGFDFVPPVGVRVDYKEQGQTQYRTLHTVDSSNRLNKFITTNLLQVGKTYDFKVTFGNITRTITQAITSNDMSFGNVLAETTCDAID